MQTVTVVPSSSLTGVLVIPLCLRALDAWRKNDSLFVMLGSQMSRQPFICSCLMTENISSTRDFGQPASSAVLQILAIDRM